jgi:hypothetical protein
MYLNRFRALEKRVLRRISVPKTEEVTKDEENFIMKGYIIKEA